MADPSDLLLGAGGGAGVVAGLVGVVKWLGGRSINALDKTLEHLEKSIQKQGDETKQLISELSREMRTLRDTDIRQAEQIGALQKGMSDVEKRIDGQASHYREQLEAHRKAIFDRMTETIADLGRKKR